MVYTAAMDTPSGEYDTYRDDIFAKVHSFFKAGYANELSLANRLVSYLQICLMNKMNYETKNFRNMLLSDTSTKEYRNHVSELAC